MKRLTTDNPTTNFEVMLNYTQVKDREVILSYADGKKNVNLCEYIAKLANKKGCYCTAEQIREGDCCMGIDCECCEVAILNMVAIQAAELRERLKYYENKEEAKEES